MSCRGRSWRRRYAHHQPGPAKAWNCGSGKTRAASINSGFDGHGRCLRADVDDLGIGTAGTVLVLPDSTVVTDRYSEPDKMETALVDPDRWPVAYWYVDARMAGSSVFPDGELALRASLGIPARLDAAPSCRGRTRGALHGSGRATERPDLRLVRSSRPRLTAGGTTRFPSRMSNSCVEGTSRDTRHHWNGCQG